MMHVRNPILVEYRNFVRALRDKIIAELAASDGLWAGQAHAAVRRRYYGKLFEKWGGRIAGHIHCVIAIANAALEDGLLELEEPVSVEEKVDGAA